MLWFKKKNEKNSLEVVEQSGAHDGHCFLSSSMRINGELMFSGTLRVDGRIDGKVTAHQGKKAILILSKGAVITGPVKTGDLICDGTIQGDVNVEGRLELRSNAIIRGQVSYSSIHIAEGAKLEGRCVQHSQIMQNTKKPAARPQVVAGTALGSTAASTNANHGHPTPVDMTFLKKPSNGQG